MNHHIKTVAIAYTPLLSRGTAVLAATAALAFLLYGVFLLAAVGNTAERSQAQHKISELKSELSDLQSQYLAKTKDITYARATELGFVAPEESVRIFTQAPTSPLTLHTAY